MPSTQPAEELINAIKRQIEIAAQKQLPGDTASMIVVEWNKFPHEDFGHDANIVLEVMIEQVIIAHRMRYTDTKALTSNTPEDSAWVSHALHSQSMLLCDISDMWLEAKDKSTHERLFHAVDMLLGDIHGMDKDDTGSELIAIWQHAFNLALPYWSIKVLNWFILVALVTHIERAKDGDINEQINANLAFTRRALVFRLKAPQAKKSRDELDKLESLWEKVVKEE